MVADVVDWSAAKFQVFDQTANNTSPTTPSSYRFMAQLAGAPGDFGSGVGDVTFEDNTAFNTSNMNPINDFGSGPSDWEFEQEFATQTALDAAFPNAWGDSAKEPVPSLIQTRFAQSVAATRSLNPSPFKSSIAM